MTTIWIKGNGMRYDVHKAFKERFGIKGVEMYGATEGNCLLLNLEGKYGACGIMPHVHRWITTLPIYIIRIDKDLNPIRDKNGFCMLCDPGEKGIIVGVIGNSIKEVITKE